MKDNTQSRQCVKPQKITLKEDYKKALVAKILECEELKREKVEFAEMHYHDHILVRDLEETILRKNWQCGFLFFLGIIAGIFLIKG